MSLVELWKTEPEHLKDKAVNQVIAFAGGGALRDGTTASSEFCAFLGQIPSRVLMRYAGECLESKFSDSGFALQDVVNEVGRRLGFEVTNGRYRGTTGQVGFDGLWIAPEGGAIVVEVKTTDAYRIDLNVLSGYRKRLVEDDTMREDNSSILIVVGRQDTGDLEAQIRGSRSAWDIRIISVEYLLKLLKLREDIEEPGTARQIRTILVPQEFTRVDGIVDLLFATTEDVLQEEPPDDAGDRESEKRFTPVSFHEECIERINDVLGVSLIKKSRASFTTPDKAVRVVCAVSKEHEQADGARYWFAYHTHQSEFLEEARDAFVAFGCGSAKRVLLIPFSDFRKWLSDLNQSHAENRSYWHVHILRHGERYLLRRKEGRESVDVSSFELEARAG